MIQKLKLVAVVFFMLAFLVALLSVLQYHRFKTLLYEVNGSRISVPTGDLTRDIERSLEVGLALKTNAQLPSMLDQVRSKHNDILVAEIVDSQEASQTVYWKVGSLQIDHARYIALQQRSGKSIWFDPTAKEGLVQVTSIKDPLARDVAKLIVVFQKDSVEGALTQAKDYVIKICSIIFLTTLCLMMFLLFYGLKRLERLTTSARGVLNSEGAALASAETSEIVDLAKRVNRYLHNHRDLDGHKPL